MAGLDSMSRRAAAGGRGQSKGGLDFIDINMGCPILVCNKGAGSMLQTRAHGAASPRVCPAPLMPPDLKTRMGYFDNKRVAHEIIPKMVDWGLAG